MLATNASLDVSVPFRMTKIVNAAEYCLSPNWFDKHLGFHMPYPSSDTDPEQELPAKRSTSSKKGSLDTDSESEIQPLFRPHPHHIKSPSFGKAIE